MVNIGDVVMIYYREIPTFFARIDSIKADVKKDWFNVELLILSIPLRTLTWTLREEYINGAPFTMEGNNIRIEPVKPLPIKPDTKETKKMPAKENLSKNGNKVIPFKKPRGKVS
ncbi:MAG TPA: hypothetical protein VMW42_05575 [Desulfatiglandales bacterium]|nr:hypothetical protein [Desulfatiglandales bacterium]